MRPNWPERLLATPADHAACRRLIRGGSRTFFAASLLLPRAVREPALALYAFCRLADDAVDNGGGTAALAALRNRLDRAYRGRPAAIAADRAFADTVARFAIPRVLPEALLEGFEWDAAGRVYDDLDSLNAYAARVAGSVGAMMALLMDARSPDQVARACDLGVAMQLTNIARDVGEDARAGRLYLPRDWLAEAGVDPQAWLARPAHSAALGAVVGRLLAAADALYERADGGIARLPASCRPGITAARLLYAGIGDEVRRAACDAVSRRAVVPASRKIALVLRGAAAAPSTHRGPVAAALPETQFLVDASVSASRPVLAPPSGKVGWLVDLFERLERQQAQRLRS